MRGSQSRVGTPIPVGASFHLNKSQGLRSAEIRRKLLPNPAVTCSDSKLVNRSGNGPDKLPPAGIGCLAVKGCACGLISHTLLAVATTNYANKRIVQEQCKKNLRKNRQNKDCNRNQTCFCDRSGGLVGRSSPEQIFTRLAASWRLRKVLKRLRNTRQKLENVSPIEVRNPPRL